MNKYIDADELIAEIERLKKKNKELQKSGGSIGQEFLFGIGAGYADVSTIITSLQQEQPEVELDREIIKYKVPFTDEREYLNETTLDAIARHFYKLGCKAKKYE